MSNDSKKSSHDAIPFAVETAVQVNESALVLDVKKIVRQAKSQAYAAVNSATVQAYWLIGRRIVEEEQGGEKRAEYGKYVIATLSRELTAEFGRGFSVRSLREFRQFYTTFPEFLESLEPDVSIRRTLSAESQANSKRVASWSFLTKLKKLK